MEPKEPPTLIVAGGGTGGHVLAGIAVADAWRAKHGKDGRAARILFVGAEGGIEEKLVPRAGYPLELLRLGSLNRVSVGRKLRTLALLPVSLLRSALIVSRFKPTAVLGVGGYASGPLVLMARVLRFLGLSGARTAILEQNAVPGFTNRVLGGWVSQVFCAFSAEKSGFSASKTRVTGNPIRSSIRPLTPASRDPFTVFAFGGSQGAAGINTLVLDAVPELGELRARVRFIHQTGEKDYERVVEGHRKLGTRARVEKFIYDMPEAYAQSALLVCRAGSSTLAEVAAVGRASILVPFPYASDNHQEKNAMIFSDRGAAILLPQLTSKGSDLARLLRELILAPDKVSAMEKAVAAFYRPEAACEIAASLSP